MGTAERRQREKRQREEQIQEAAVKVLLEKGFNGTTIEEIAAAAELSPGTIYLYFKNKEELYASINLRAVQEIDRQLTVLVESEEPDPVEKLRSAWQALETVYCQSPVNIQALIHGQLQGSLQNISPDLLAALNSTAKSIINQIAAIFRRGMAETVFQKANPLALADVFWGTFTGVVAWEEAKRTTDPEKSFLRPTLDQAFKIFVEGIKV